MIYAGSKTALVNELDLTKVQPFDCLIAWTMFSRFSKLPSGHSVFMSIYQLVVLFLLCRHSSCGRCMISPTTGWPSNCHVTDRRRRTSSISAYFWQEVPGFPFFRYYSPPPPSIESALPSHWAVSVRKFFFPIPFHPVPFKILSHRRSCLSNVFFVMFCISFGEF